jgi:pyroglutamyl-peptidase
MKILITGFDPFGKEEINPSYEAVRRLPDEILGHQLIKAEVPTVTYKAIEKTIELMKTHEVDIVINVGQAGGRTAITPERVAINVSDFRIEDNEGNQPIETKIDQDGPDGLFSTLPIQSMVETIKSKNIPSTISNTAGTFVCNQLMYGVLNYISMNKLNVKAGFIHIPFMTEQVIDKPQFAAMSLEMLTEGLTAAVEGCIQIKTSNQSFGTEH